MRLVSSDGATVVDAVSLSGTRGRDGAWLRVKRCGFFVGEVRSPGELDRLGVDLADFTEVSA